MVGQQRFATRSCFRFGIYSESLDRNKPRLITSKKLKLGLTAAMFTIGGLMVGLIAYDMTSAYATPKKGKDAVTHLVKLRTTSSTTMSTITTVHPPSTTTLPLIDEVTTTQESWTSPTEIEEDVLTSALPLPRSARAKKVQEPYRFELPLPPSASDQGYNKKMPSQRRVMHGGGDTSPRPFRTKSNHTLERINRINAYKNSPVLPYYSFTAPHRYPQLANYRYPSNPNNIQDIIKYLTEDNGKPVTSPNGHYLDAGVFRVPSGTATKAIKFAGVYRSTKVDGDRVQETKDDFRVSNEGFAGASPPLLNGHAYIADPFQAYKPTNPAEVNQLASNTDFRHRHHSDRYQYSNAANGWGNTFEVNSNNKYFPRPPINFGRPSAAQSESSEHTHPSHHTNSHTSVIYRPFGSETSSTSFPPYIDDNNYPKKNMKPISVLLDIYPMMEDPSLHTSSPTNVRPRPAQGFGQKLKFPHAEHQNNHHQDNDGKHQMVVHLNLYPRKKKKNIGFSNRSDDDDSDDKSDDLDQNQHCNKQTKSYEELEEEEEGDVEYISKLNKGDSEILWRFSKVNQEDNEESWNEPLPSAAALKAVDSVVTTIEPVQL